MKKEIIESKKSFDTVWVTEECISKLSRNIFENDKKVIQKSLVEAFVSIPYLAIISKKQLSNTISKNLDTLHESISYSKSDLKEYVQSLFEMKKPLKSLVSNLLQEKYGININNIKEIPTFKTLLNTQALIFESIAKVSPRNSVIRECLVKMSEMLKNKNGIEAIDINEGIKYLFENSGLTKFYEDEHISSSFELNEAVGEEDSVSLIMNKLILEDEDAVLDIIDKEEEEEEVKSSDKDEKPSSEEEEEVKSSDEVEVMSTKDLMNTLKDIEDLVSGPEELDQE